MKPQPWLLVGGLILTFIPAFAADPAALVSGRLLGDQLKAAARLFEADGLKSLPPQVPNSFSDLTKLAGLLGNKPLPKAYADDLGWAVGRLRSGRLYYLAVSMQ